MNIPPPVFRGILAASFRSRIASCSRKARGDAFSLVEVVIALGIFAFVIIPVIGLVSGGMKNLRQSMDDTVRSDIAREIASEALRTPFTNVVATNRYFTDEGVETNSNTGAYVFIASTTLTNNNAISLLSGTTSNTAKVLNIRVYHYQDSNNNQTVLSQLLINTGQ